MPDKTYEYEGDGPKKPHKGVEISDLRHKRNVEEDSGEPEAGTPAEPEKPAADDKPAKEKDTPPPEEKPAAVEPPPEPEPEAEVEEEIGRPDGGAHHASGEEEMAAMEMEQLRLIFSAGLTAYLHSQLGMLLNFAMINLGRAPNPATGILSADLDKARISIDMMEFIVSRIQTEIPAEERAGAVKIIGELKYVYMQLVSGGPAVPGGGPEA